MNVNIREEIIEFLIVHQPYIKAHLEELKAKKESRIANCNPSFRYDINEQYEVRIKQWIAFYVTQTLPLPIEYIIIELEKIELEDYLNVSIKKEV
jgi:2-oxoglutarate dehydrogenase complex dehydrogenase (E1) component-like enzyme